uniref:Olfactory receptor 3 n=1 Tax=Meteorus pulchricornis TaxID=51522 RepID=A0A1S5VFI7_9HYME|nr:olfactory receptor 3 [Meteorus pulchricornis]
MDFLSPSFTVLQYCGVWPPTYYSWWKKIFYSLYTTVIAIAILLFCLSGVIQLCLITRSIDEFIRNSYMLLTTFAVSMKVVMIIIKRNQVIRTFEILHLNSCKASNEEEKLIERESDPQSRWACHS